MNPNYNFALCILNKNEADNLENICNQIDRTLFSKIFSIDGRSTDRSVKILQKLGIETIIQKEPGRGTAIRLAIDTVSAFNPEIEFLILISSDGNEDPGDIEKIMRLLPSFDLVIASRMLPDSWNEEDSQKFRPRKATNKFFSYLAFFILRTKKSKYISDPLNGLRGFKLEYAKNLNLVSRGYAIEYEMSIKSYIYDSKVIEIPTIEHERLSGISMVPPVRTVIQLLRILFQVFIMKMSK
jgi:hypothetical protein